MMITVAIVDDHPLVIEGLQNILRHSSDMKVVATFLNGKALLENMESIQPDVLLLDISMPDMQGDQLARIIRRDFPKVKVIALTNLDNIYFIKNMLQQGVSGYVLKNADTDTLVTAIKAVYEGRQFLDDTVKKRIEREKEIIKEQSVHGAMLTRREKEVLDLIMKSYTSKEIAHKLYISKRTVDHHRESIFSKLEVKNVSALLKKAIALGLVVPPFEKSQPEMPNDG